MRATALTLLLVSSSSLTSCRYVLAGYVQRTNVSHNTILQVIGFTFTCDVV